MADFMVFMLALIYHKYTSPMDPRGLLSFII